MNFLLLISMQLRKPNYNKCQDFFSTATQLAGGCDESRCGLRMEIRLGCARVLPGPSRHAGPSADVGGRGALEECGYLLLSHLFCVSSDSCWCFEVDFLSAPHLVYIRKFKRIYAHFSLLQASWRRERSFKAQYRSCILGLQSRQVRPATVAAVLEKEVLLLE